MVTLSIEAKHTIPRAKHTYIISLYSWQMKALFPFFSLYVITSKECDRRLQSQLHNYSAHKLKIHCYIFGRLKQKNEKAQRL